METLLTQNRLDDAGLPAGLMARIRAGFRLDWHGVHGAAHWVRVMRHGLHLAAQTGADPQVVRLFAVLHDSQRFVEGSDPGHGARAAAFVRHLQAKRVLRLEDTRADWLTEVCRQHS